MPPSRSLSYLMYISPVMSHEITSVPVVPVVHHMVAVRRTVAVRAAAVLHSHTIHRYVLRCGKHHGQSEVSCLTMVVRRRIGAGRGIAGVVEEGGRGESRELGLVVRRGPGENVGERIVLAAAVGSSRVVGHRMGAVGSVDGKRLHMRDYVGYADRKMECAAVGHFVGMEVVQANVELARCIAHVRPRRLVGNS